MLSLTKIRKWALLKLSWVPLEPRDQPLCGNYLFHNTHDLMQSSQQLWREISHPLTLFDGEGTGNPLQYSCLENPMDGGAWWAAVHGVAKSRKRLSDFTFTFHFQALEKEMATHASVLAWRIPGMGEPGGLWSLGLHRDRHDWSDLAAAQQPYLTGEKTKTQGIRVTIQSHTVKGDFIRLSVVAKAQTSLILSDEDPSLCC